MKTILAHIWWPVEPVGCQFQNTRWPIWKCCSHNHQSAPSLSPRSTLKRRIRIQGQEDDSKANSNGIFSHWIKQMPGIQHLDRAVVAPSRGGHKGLRASSLSRDQLRGPRSSIAPDQEETALDGCAGRKVAIPGRVCKPGEVDRRLGLTSAISMWDGHKCLPELWNWSHNTT